MLVELWCLSSEHITPGKWLTLHSVPQAAKASEVICQLFLLAREKTVSYPAG